MKNIKVLVAGVITVSGVCLFNHVAFADDSSSLTSKGSIGFVKDEQGTLTIDHVSDFKFGEQKTSGSNKVYYAALDGDKANFVQVTDKRGTNAGWHLTVTEDEQFKNESNDSLTGAVLKLDNGTMTSADDGIAPTANQEISLTPGTASDVINAQVDQGTGIWVDSFGSDAEAGQKSVSVTVPGKTKKVQGEYTTSLTWNLADTPA
ncbi:WxL domain-containing protein [Listeria sp. PSOL-1]|uniref:WxL domain-containing protein n=1 Tax=Listeria sp. PSOL-1 TaxID=1844999 RepID=UPI0013D8A6FC|nr:WxL domain-containing protein [Listeria sp. PSOL-1]